jgi:hypothetical protein
MTSKQFISFIGGLLLTAFSYGLLVLAFMFATFSFAGETLTSKENREAVFFYSAVSAIGLTLYFIYRRLKSQRKYSAIGIAVSLFFAFYILFETGQVYFDNLNYHQKFDKAKWTQSQSKPFKMAKTMTKDRVLIGQTKQQIIEKLGAETDTLKNEKADYFKYFTDNGTWELIIWFNEGKVVDAYLYEEGLGV